MSLTILAAAFVVIGGGVAYLLGLWDRPEFVYKQHLLAATRQEEEEKTQQTLASKKTSDNNNINKHDKSKNDDQDQDDDAKEVYILLVKGQKPPHSKHQCEMLHGAKKSLDRVMGSEKDADALLQKGAQVMGGEEKCGVAVVAMYLDNNNSNASTSHESATTKAEDEDDDDDDDDDDDVDDNNVDNNSPTDTTTPKDNGECCPRWGCGFVVGCKDLKEAQEIAKGMQKDSDQTIVALRVGGPDQPVLQARIPWRHYLSPMIASRLHWQRCYDLYDAPDSPYHSDGGRREGDKGNDNDNDDLIMVDGSVAMETFVVCQKQKFMWIDYTLLMGNTQPIWDAMDPQ